MKLLVDHADIQQIRELMEVFPLDGVTTNPSILKNNGVSPMEALRDIRALIGPDKALHAQVVSTNAEQMCREARHMVKTLGGSLFVKIPATTEGFKAMTSLHREGIPVTATTIFTPMQAYTAAKCGASYVAPYINRICDTGCDGLEVLAAIQEILLANHMDTQVIAANFKNLKQMEAAAVLGVDSATATPDLIRQLGINPMVDSILDRFTADFEALTGPGMTMADF